MHDMLYILIQKGDLGSLPQENSENIQPSDALTAYFWHKTALIVTLPENKFYFQKKFRGVHCNPLSNPHPHFLQACCMETTIYIFYIISWRKDTNSDQRNQLSLYRCGLILTLGDLVPWVRFPEVPIKYINHNNEFEIFQNEHCYQVNSVFSCQQ